MKKTGYSTLLRAFFPIFNAIILIIYIINYDIASRFFLGITILCLCLCILCIIAIRSFATISRYLHNTQITLFTIIFLFLFFEFMSWVFPNLIPLRIRNYLATGDINVVRSEMVEYLNESPFVKFKPNTIIRSQGYRGTNDQFVYEWKTDKLGFKNLNNVANKEQVDIIVLGNSFMEGMGIAADKTCSSILTAKGYPTYNLSVQGYAPTQLEGMLRKYGLKLKPKFIIIGYCATTFLRERAFFDQENVVKNRKFTGGIHSIANSEIRRQAKYFVSATYLFLRNKIPNSFIHEIRKFIKNKKIYS